jgi:hypothetical protein
LSLPAFTLVTGPEPSLIGGNQLPIQRAEELLATLPVVISARIVAGPTGAVEEIHILTTDGIAPKATVRNVESALIAHLGMRVSHKKISVATSSEPRPRIMDQEVRQSAPAPSPVYRPTPPEPMGAIQSAARRLIVFENVEVRRSRVRGVMFRVTLRKGDQSFVGEAEGLETERLRIELAARATLSAISQSEGESRALAFEGCKVVEAFDRQFVFVGITARAGRDTSLLTGSAEIKESPETSSVLAVLDATNRWIEFPK